MKIRPNWHDVLSQQLINCDEDNKGYELIQLEQSDFAVFTKIFHETCKPTQERMSEFRKFVKDTQRKYENKEFNSPKNAIDCIFRNMMHKRGNAIRNEITQVRHKLYGNALKLACICNQVQTNAIVINSSSELNSRFLAALNDTEKQSLNALFNHDEFDTRRCTDIRPWD
jgi:uncharacterized protein YpuA (DUF1002 family)